MSVEKAKEFLLSFKEKAPDEAFIEKWKSAESEDERMQLYVELAGSMGYDLQATEIKEVLTKLDNEHKAKTLAAKKEMEALADDELEHVAGGEEPKKFEKRKEGSQCIYDFEDTSCWSRDACRSFNAIYIYCKGKYHYPVN